MTPPHTTPAPDAAPQRITLPGESLCSGYRLFPLHLLNLLVQPVAVHGGRLLVVVVENYAHGVLRGVLALRVVKLVRVRVRVRVRVGVRIGLDPSW